MPQAQWTFWRPSRAAPRQDPTYTEHFTQDDLAGFVEALTREVIQNSLDEPAQPGGAVRVRFSFSGLSGALMPERAARYFESLYPHLQMCGIPFAAAAAVPYLVVEDFGTRGLVGDPAQSEDNASDGNFYYFWRNIGRTNKRAAEGGTWGLGKAVYPAVSAIQSFFGLSVREEAPRAVLMGHSLLRMHGRPPWSPYGWYGNADRDGFVLPVTAADQIEEFRRDFQLQRREETGLSLAIPLPDAEITPDAITASVLRQYFFAIASGRLSVTVETPEHRTEIDRANLDRLAESLSLAAGLGPLLSLSRAALNPGIVVPVINNKPASAPRWENCEIDAEALADLRRRFERGEALAFSVPVTVRPVKQAPVDSSFRVYLTRDVSGKRDRPMFIRGGILIPHATDDRLAGVRALAVVQDGPLAGFVRDSENPSHTEWRRDSTHFRGKYELGPSTLAFVRQAPAQIYARLAQPDEERDTFALADLFHVPNLAESGLAAGVGAGEQLAAIKAPPSSEREEGEPGPPPQFAIRRLAGGFTVAANPEAPRLPAEIEVRIAYMVRGGVRQAFDNYHPFDFRLEALPVEVVGARVTERAGNRLVLADAGHQLRVTASGFDTLRDLVVRVTPLENEEKADAAET
jgi:hypothetical protein